MPSLGKINKSVIFLLSTLWLAACSQPDPDDVLISGAFGLSFGERPEGFGESFLSELKSIEVREPPSPDSRFEKYFYTVTPGSHRIYQVNAVTDGRLTRSACDALVDDLSNELRQKYYTAGEAIINDSEDKWVLQRNTKRAVSLQCLTAPSSTSAGNEQLYQLSLSYLDYNLATEAYKEWNKRADSPEKY